MYNRFFFRKLGCLSDPLSCSRPSGYSCIILINVQTLHVASCILRKFCVLFCCIIFFEDFVASEYGTLCYEKICILGGINCSVIERKLLCFPPKFASQCFQK